MMYNRGGIVLKSGKIGRVNVLRQQMLLPGERISPSVRGEVRMAPLRERETAHMHARIDAFVTPIRWLWDGWPQYVKDGPASSASPPVVTPAGYTQSDLGIGSYDQGDGSPILKFFQDAPTRIYNEWYKWPEDADAVRWVTDGWKGVNLAHSWTRLQKYDGILDADSKQTVADGKFDLRDLAELQARYRQAVEREWIAHDRYIELLKECWNAQGSREVDKVPLRLRGDEAGVDPQTIWANDASGLGAAASIYDFKLDHMFGSYVAPEHSIVTYMLLIRMAPVAADEINPMSVVRSRDWASLVGEPGMLASQKPVAVQANHIGTTQTDTTRGYLPAGWQWRARWNCIGKRIDIRNSFPLIQQISQSTATAMRDPTRIGNPFVNETLGHYTVNVMFNEPTDSPIPGPRSSLFSGAGSSGMGSAYPYPGPRKVV